MSIIRYLLSRRHLVSVALALLLIPGAHAAEQHFTMRIQTAVPSSSLYFELLQHFGERIAKMSGGRLKADVLPDGAVVHAFDILDAVNNGVIEAGFAWANYWSGKNSAYILFTNVPASTGLDQRSLMAWFYYGGGQQLYDELDQKVMGLNVVPFMIQPMGPDPLGWFKQPINNMNDFKKFKYRAPPGIAGQTYKDMGVSAVAMPGGDIVPAAQRGVIDAAEWIGPADDRNLGLQKIWKYYYLQGLHQQSDIGELDINKQFWDKLPADLQEIIRVAALATQAETYNADIYKNAQAVKEFEDKDHVKVLDTPPDYYKAFIEAQNKITADYAKQNPFFKKVLESQVAFAKLVYPYRSRVLELYSNLLKTAHETQGSKQ